MKRFYLPLVFMLSVATSAAQTISWSPDIIQPKEKDLFTNLQFPGMDAANYYVNEAEAGGISTKRRWTEYGLKIDKATLKMIKETNISKEIAGDGKEYYNARNFFMGNKRYSVFMDINSKDIYDVYTSIQSTEGGSATPIQSIQKIDITKSKPFSSMSSPMAGDVNKTMSIYYSTFYINQIKPAYDKKSIISAFIYQSVDKEYSMLNICEWDENLKAITTNNYKIPFWARQGSQKTIFGAMGTSGGDFPMVVSFAKDPNGFFYVLVKSADPANKKDNNMTWLFQFKLSDPTYTKVFHKEIYNNSNSFMPFLHQDESGKVFISNVGREVEDPEKNDFWYQNKALIAGLDAKGQLDVIANKALTSDMMYTFEKQKKVDKENGVHDLWIRNILPVDGDGCYVVWEHEEKSDGLSGNADYSNYGNLLIQYYDKAHKLLWEKPVYKQQQQRQNLLNNYAGISSMVVDKTLYLFYPDDAKNATKDIADKDVEKFSVVKFGNKDLAGMFMLSYNTQGNVTRKYIAWPEEKKGFALLMPSLQYGGNNEFFGTVRKISQGAMMLKSLEYTFFKIKM